MPDPSPVSHEEVARDLADGIFALVETTASVQTPPPDGRPRVMFKSPGITKQSIAADITAALRIASRSEWRPISEAPKDTMFIYYEPRDGKRCIGLAYRTVSGEWRDSESEWSRPLRPTHWMPLPPPPEQRGTE